MVEVLAQPRNAETPKPALGFHRTPNRSFFVRTHFSEPRVSRARWVLDVDGAVRHPGRYTMHDLDAAPHRRAEVTLECAGNGRAGFGRTARGELAWGTGAVSNALWEGVPLQWMLRRARPLATAREVVVAGSDGDARVPGETGREFTRSLPITLATTNPDILIATRMNEAPLPRAHGGPARLVVPGWYAMASVKWVRRITVRTEPFRGYFQTVKYVYRTDAADPRAPSPVSEVRVKSLLTSPTAGARLPLGRVARFRGKAWSGRGPIVRVEVDVGSGWEPASLSSGSGPHGWVEWAYACRPKGEGKLLVRVRATDASGARQPLRAFANRFQYGYNAVETVAMTVVKR